MNTSVVANEFAKMRRLRVGLVAAVMVTVVVGLSVFSAISSPDFTTGTRSSWNLLLSGMSLAVPLSSSLLIPVLASRQSDIEHQGGGWLLAETSGLTPGGLCRIKFVALGVIVAAATVLGSAFVAGAGLLLGVTAAAPGGLWIGYTVSVLIVNLVILALHVLLSARLENQLVGLGVGVLGTVVAMFAPALPLWLAHATPWGYYALATAADYRDGALVALTPSYPSIVALGVVGAVVFTFVTVLFDRREV